VSPLQVRSSCYLLWILQIRNHVQIPVKTTRETNIRPPSCSSSSQIGGSAGTEVRNQGEEASSFNAADYAAEISRLEVITSATGESEQRLLGSGREGSLLEKEMRSGPLAELLQESHGDANLALLRAKARLAAYNARTDIETRRSAPPWLSQVLKLLVLPLLLGVIVPPLVNLFTVRQQLDLFREQKSFETKRSQADLLLGQLASLTIRARELKGSVDYFEVPELSQGQANRLYNKAVELEQDFRLAVQLHHFNSYPALHQAERSAYYELRALQDCLLKAPGRPPSASWRQGTEKVSNDEMRRAITSDKPCGDNFNTDAFGSLTSAVNHEIASRIGGSLFPPSD
jgi:hypothetical protein